MPLERIDKGGEVVLTRDKSVPNILGNGNGSFTLGDMREFVTEVELNGGADNTRILTHSDVNGVCQKLIVPVEHGVVPMHNDKVSEPYLSLEKRQAAMVLLCWIVSILIAYVLF